MFERKVPHWEGLELRIAGLHSPFVFMVELAQAYCHLSASRSRSRDDNKRPCRLNIIILAETFLRVNQGYIVRITVNRIMVADRNTQTLKSFTVSIGTCLSIKVGDYDRSYIESDFFEFLSQTQDILIVCDTEVSAHFVFLYIKSTDYLYDLSAVT